MTIKNTSVHPQVAIQSLLRPALPSVSANKDFEEFKQIIEYTDRTLISAGLEDLAIRLAIENLEKTTPKAGKAAKRRQASQAIKALRVNALKTLLGGISCRALSTAVYKSELLADFCRVFKIDGIKGLPKSEVDRMLSFFTEEQMTLFHDHLTGISTGAESCKEIGLENPVDSVLTFFDSTCLEANIHYPVDWLLLKDVSLTLLQGISLIRKAGLFCRMPQSPEDFAREMNKLCIAMTHSARRKESKRLRKQVFRRMKKLLTTIGGHGERYRDLLIKRWTETKYTEAQKDQIVARLSDMLDKLPKVKKQAHERIIGERQVPSSEKILSVYEDDVQVIVRRKAGKAVEFGNTLMICEGMHGYILDWKLYRQSAPSESLQLAESLNRLEAMNLEEPVIAACTDRGFNSKATRKLLKERKIYDATCPRDPAELKERLNRDDVFPGLQRRRGSTEARIAILRQKQGGRLREKGFERRSLAVGWSVIGHNLWLISRLLAQQESETKVAA